MVVGIDEVGRGSLAGPLVIGVVSLVEPIAGLRDSKKLSKKRRLELAELIYQKSNTAQLGWVWPHEIDALGMTDATTLAIRRGLSLLDEPPTSIIMDGKFNYLETKDNVTTIIGGDDLIPEVSAASIIAKVARDSYMVAMDQHFPDYGFESHVGYGTASHLQSISSFGPCPLHRLSFKPLSS
jgi:ribonuclease HII